MSWSGAAARPASYISITRELGIDEGTSDEIGILITRLNATMLIAALGEDAYPKVAESHAEAKKYGESGKIVVMGGITPGQTTDAVAAVLAERVGAAVFINATSVDGIYTADPAKDPDATRFNEMTPKKLLEIVGGAALEPAPTTCWTSSQPASWSGAGSRLSFSTGGNRRTSRTRSSRADTPAPWSRKAGRTRCRSDLRPGSQKTITYFYHPTPSMMARGSRVAWSILERLGRFDGGSNPPYPIES